ncbi:MAG: hypothetical protein GF401_07140 [Chitinivibrionales bacterium]|nr:hypothetical protein [Chitinivibrionales bacterium]
MNDHLSVKLSPWCYLFYFCIVSGYVCSLFGEPDTTADALTEDARPFIIALKPAVTYRYPVGELAHEWAPYITGGLLVDLPTYTNNFIFRIALEAGKIKSKNIESFDYTIFHPSLSLCYTIKIANNVLLRPRIGVTSTTIHISDESIVRNLDLMATWESEFGALVGIEPSFRFNKLEFSLPAGYTRIFSSPHPFSYTSISFTVGVHI